MGNIGGVRKRGLTLAKVEVAMREVIDTAFPGVFKNDPEVVARLFRDALQRWNFYRVVFAIYGGGHTYDTFQRVLYAQD